jgi:hypothetical protein
MKLKLFIVLPALILICSVVFLGNVNAQYSNICNDPNMADYELEACEEAYNSCLAYPYTLEPTNEEGYLDCIGNQGCNAINRYQSYNTQEDCVNWEEKLTPEKYEYSWRESIKTYCDCMRACLAEYYQERDCDEELSDCCNQADITTPIVFHKDLEVVIKSIEGDVEIQRRGTDDYVIAQVGDKLKMGDYIVTGFESQCTLIFEKVAEFDLKELTHFAIAQFFVQGNLAKTAISVRMGEVTTNTKTPQGMRAKFEIEPMADAVSIRGTTFTIRYDPDFEIAEYIAHESDIEVEDTDNGNVYSVSEGYAVMIDETDGEAVIGEMLYEDMLTEEEWLRVAEYEQDNYYNFEDEAESDGEKEEILTGLVDPTSYGWVGIVCIALICIIGLGLLAIILIILIRGKKK